MEQRLQDAEALLNALSQSNNPRAQNIIENLRRDPRAREILEQLRGQDSSGQSSNDDTDSSGELEGAMQQMSFRDNRRRQIHGASSNDDGYDDNLRQTENWTPSQVAGPGPQSSSAALIHTSLPPPAERNHLVEIFFAYVNPALPVVDKSSFMEEHYSSIQHSQQSELLSLSLFAIAAHYAERGRTATTVSGRGFPGDGYAIRARTLLMEVLTSAQLVVCQASLLLAFREIGVGSTSGSLLVGIAIQVAQALGLHRSDTYRGRNPPLSASQQRIRRQIWWACCFLDKFIAVDEGKPPAIRPHDFDIPLPDRNPQPDDADLWEPYSLTVTERRRFIAVPGLIPACFRASAALSTILDAIMEAMYSIRPYTFPYRQQRLLDLKRELNTWGTELPAPMQYDFTAARTTAPTDFRLPPHVLHVHVQYWHTVLVLHRAFVPIRNSYVQPSTAQDTAGRLSRTSFRTCVEAGDHITSIVNLYQQVFGLAQCSPFMVSYVLAAGIIHVSNGANQSVLQCTSVLRELQSIWPRARGAIATLEEAQTNIANDNNFSRGNSSVR